MARFLRTTPPGPELFMSRLARASLRRAHAMVRSPSASTRGEAFSRRIATTEKVMVVDSSPSRRLEWKYRVPPESTGELLAQLEPRTHADAYCTGPGGVYHVRSLYYDTPDLRFYHETKDGLRVRRKLRVRHYGTAHYFLEIKRKLNKRVLKERVQVPAPLLADALDGVDPAVVMSGRPDGDLRTLERFRFNLRTLGLIPTLLIAYERRAMVGQADPDLRITLDRDLRGRTRPGSDEPFREARLVTFEPRHVLELKFPGRPPHWLMAIVRQLHLERVPYSKYCEGIDRCASVMEGPADQPGEARTA